MKKGNVFWRLVGYECRKAFLNPWMLVFFAVLLAVNGWKITDKYNQRVSRWSEYQQVYETFYDRYGGTITTEKVSDLMAVYGPLEAKRETTGLNMMYDPNAYTYSEQMDHAFFSTLFYTEMQYDYLYVNEAHRIASNARELAEFYEGVGNRFEAGKNRQITQDFSSRGITTFGDTRGYEVLLHYDYSVMLVLLLTVFALSGIFVSERETEMDMLLRTTKNGSGATVAAKFTAAFLFVVVTCGLFFAEDFLCVFLAGGRNEAIQNPVYALRYFEATPLTMTIGAYFLWAGVVRTLGVLACGMVILLVSSLCKQMLSAFLSGFGLLLGGVLLQEFCRTRHAFQWFNPLELVMVRDIVTEDVFVNVFGFAVHLYVFVILGVLLTMAVLAAAILYCSRSYHRRGGRRAGHVSV